LHCESAGAVSAALFLSACATRPTYAPVRAGPAGPGRSRLTAPPEPEPACRSVRPAGLGRRGPSGRLRRLPPDLPRRGPRPRHGPQPAPPRHRPPTSTDRRRPPLLRGQLRRRACWRARACSPPISPRSTRPAGRRTTPFSRCRCGPKPSGPGRRTALRRPRRDRGRAADRRPGLDAARGPVLPADSGLGVLTFEDGPADEGALRRQQRPALRRHRQRPMRAAGPAGRENTSGEAIRAWLAAHRGPEAPGESCG
jgi:hypothetical protein